MADDVLINKSETIEKCIKRIHEIYADSPAHLRQDQTKQDAILLNLERACQAAIDLGMRMVKLKTLGIPKESREAFSLLEQAKILSPTLAGALKKMVGFRNVVVHDYQKLNLDMVENLIKKDFPDLRELVSLALTW